MSGIKEVTGNTEAVRSLKHYGYGAYKIADVRGSRFMENKPCDIIASSPKGRSIYIEGKMSKKWEGFSSKKLRPHQVIELTNNCFKRKGRSFVFLYVRIKADKNKGIERVCKLVVFDWKVHRNRLTKGYTVKQMRSQSVGVWLDPLKDDKGKIIWPLKKLLSLKNN